MRRYKYSAAGKSVAGAVKKINEDTYFMKKAYFNGSEIMFALVADGMGGVGHGMYASGLVAMDMSCWFYEEMEELFEEAILRRSSSSSGAGLSLAQTKS